MRNILGNINERIKYGKEIQGISSKRKVTDSLFIQLFIIFITVLLAMGYKLFQWEILTIYLSLS